MLVLNYLTCRNDKAQEWCDRIPIADNKTIKDPQKQAAWKKNKVGQLLEDSHHRAVSGKVWAMMTYDTVTDEINFITNTEEKQLFLEFTEVLHVNNTQYDGMVNHYIFMRNKERDYPFIAKRLLVNGISAPFGQSLAGYSDVIGTRSQSCYEFNSTNLEDAYLLGIQDRLQSWEKDGEALYQEWRMGNEDALLEAKTYLEALCELHANILQFKYPRKLYAQIKESIQENMQ
jgi:hypothetical protein